MITSEEARKLIDDLELFQNIAKGSDTDIHVVRAYLADNMEQSGGVISEDAAWNYIKTLLNSPVLYEARIEGTPKHFAGVIFDELDRNTHIIEKFDVPINWAFYEGIDPSEGKPVAWGFFAVSTSEYELTNNRTVNSVYWIDYLKLEGMAVSDITKQVNKKRAEWGYKRPIWVVLDQKYGLRTMQTGDDTTNWYNELRKYDPGVEYVLSNSKQGSIEVGESIVKEYLKLKYDSLKDKKVPTLQIFDTCEHQSDPFTPISHLFNYSRDEDRPSKRSEEYKDFIDVLRYVLERYPRYWDRERKQEYPKKKTYFKRAA
jgi:hypothetical protein